LPLALKCSTQISKKKSDKKGMICESSNSRFQPLIRHGNHKRAKRKKSEEESGPKEEEEDVVNVHKTVDFALKSSIPASNCCSRKKKQESEERGRKEA